MARSLLGFPLIVALAGLAASVPAGAFAAPADANQPEPRRVEIADPARYWRDNGFAELTPAIRVSVGYGMRTLIYLKVPEGARIATRHLAGQQRHTIRLPPGSAAARVSMTADEGGRWTTEDVRGTRWDSQGREYLYVYRPAGAEADAPLLGYEWPRDDQALQDRATDKLADLVRRLPMPFSEALPSWRGVAQFRALNDCQSCHLRDKAEATAANDPLPPWATDASGLYVPLAVLSDRAPLSTTPAFDDPNAGDRFVSARCGDGPAGEYVRRGRTFFRCADGGQPIGVYDLAAARAAGDPHAARVCQSRRYLYDRMDGDGRAAFGPAFKACGIG